MTKNNRSPRGQRRISVRGARREPVDVRKLSRALLALAQAEAEADAAMQAEAQQDNKEQAS